MKVTVHAEMCVASGNCGLVAPNVFQNPEEYDGFVKLVNPDPPQSEWTATRLAEIQCPSGTIQIDGHPLPPR